MEGQILKVSLIQPNTSNRYPQHCLGLGKIAGMLEFHCHEVQIVDADALNLSVEQVVQIIKSFQPDYVGISVRTPSLGISVKTAEKIKEAMPTVPLIIGGPHVTAFSKETLERFSCFDIGVLHEGEYTMLDVVNGCPYSKILGLVYRESNEILTTEKRPLIKNLDDLPFTAYHLMPLDHYKPYPPNLKLPFIGYISSRGCPGVCLFCYHGLFGYEYRCNSAEYVVREIENCIQKFGIKSVIFYDDTFSLNRQRVVDICNLLLERKLKIQFRCETRVNLVDEELLRLMKKAGLVHVSFGVESGNQEIINEWKKGITIDQVRRAFRLSDKVGIETILAYMIIGAPSETEKSIKESINLMKELNPDLVQWSVACPLPSTELARWYESEFGKIENVSSLMYSNIYSSKDWKPVYRSKNFTSEELMFWVRKAYREFYLRPEYFFRRFKKTKNLRMLKMNVAGLKDLLGVSAS